MKANQTHNFCVLRNILYNSNFFAQPSLSVPELRRFDFDRIVVPQKVPHFEVLFEVLFEVRPLMTV